MANFAVVIQEEPDGGYWAEVPVVPGCFTQGDDIEKLMANVGEAIAGVVAVMEEQGQMPEGKIRILDIAV